MALPLQRYFTRAHPVHTGLYEHLCLLEGATEMCVA